MSFFGTGSSVFAQNYRIMTGEQPGGYKQVPSPAPAPTRTPVSNPVSTSGAIVSPVKYPLRPIGPGYSGPSGLSPSSPIAPMVGASTGQAISGTTGGYGSGFDTSSAPMVGQDGAASTGANVPWLLIGALVIGAVLLLRR